MNSGRLSVTVGGVMRKQELCADNWDLLKMKEVSHYHLQISTMTIITPVVHNNEWLYSFTAVRVSFARNFFGTAAASQAIISKRWRCNGDERKLLSCRQINRSNCNHNNDAGVFCYGEHEIYALGLHTILV